MSRRSAGPPASRLAAGRTDGRWQWLAILGLTAVSLVFGIVGFSGYYAARGEYRSALHVLYVTLQLFTLESGSVPGPLPWTLDVARFLAPVVPAWAILRALAHIFGARLQLLRIRRWRDHVVICGLGRKGLALAQDLQAIGERVVVLDPDPENENLAVCRLLGINVVAQDAADSRALASVSAARAKHLIAVTGDDGTNVEIAVLAYRLVRDGDGSSCVHCWVQVVDLRLALLLERHRLLTEKADRFVARIFNPYESSARMALHEQALDFRRIGIRDSHGVQVIVVGFGQMGECLILQAARMGHYANGRPIRFTVIDRQAGRKERFFRERYPGFGRINSIDFIEGEADDPAILARMERLAEGPDELTTIAICIDNDSQSLSCALDVLPRIRQGQVRLLVRMSDEDGLARLLEGAREYCSWADHVHAFGNVSRVCNHDALFGERLDTLARALHEIYLSNRSASERQGSRPALVAWDSLDEAYKDSNRRSADHIPVKLRAVGCLAVPECECRDPIERFAPEEVEILARMEHRRWWVEQLLSGRSAGLVPDTLTARPGFPEWDGLDEAQRAKDRERVSEIPRIVRQVGEQVCRQESVPRS